MKTVISSIVVLGLLIMVLPALADIENPCMKTNQVIINKPLNLEFKAGALVGRTSSDSMQLAQAKKDKQSPVVLPNPPVTTSSESNRKYDKTPFPQPPPYPPGFDNGNKKGWEGESLPPGHVASPSS